ncbi:MAG TPA: isoaspartyl peptidase/L-asparaginase, partial [Opitutales bacterium]|nr:isoaspartyl peptidase/L-asparaginase [Opitutales bacterium]
MKKLLFSALLFAAPLLAAANSGPIAIAVHGGAGASPNLSKEQSNEYEAKLTEALQAGHKILADG